MSFDDFRDARDASYASLPGGSEAFQADSAPAHAHLERGDADALAAVVAMEAGTALADGLLGIDVTALTADEAVTVAREWERVTAFVLAAREQARAQVNAVLVAHFRDEEARIGEMDRLENEQRAAMGLSPIPRRLGAGFVPAELAARNELAAALRMAPKTTDLAVEHAVELTSAWVPMHAAMSAGEVSEQHVKAIGRWLRFLPTFGDPTRAEEYEAQCASVLEVVLPYAATHTPGEAGRKTKQLVLTADPAGARERRRKAAEQAHGVFLTPTEPGTCELLAVMPLAHGEAVMSAINGLAKNPRFETAAGCVTKGQRQVAALSALILGDPGTITRIDHPVTEAKIKAHISVIVPLSTITAARAQLATDHAGLLAGLAPVDGLPTGRIGTEPVSADLVREVIALASTDSTMRRLVTDEVGTVIDIGRAHYTPTGLQQRLVRLRDGLCRFPGCTTRAEACEIDHANPWDAGGATDLDNLGALCKRHHQAKTHGHWKITRSDRTGRCQWQSPLDRIYEHDPDPLVPEPAMTFRAGAPPDTTEGEPDPFDAIFEHMRAGTPAATSAPATTSAASADDEPPF